MLFSTNSGSYEYRKLFDQGKAGESLSDGTEILRVPASALTGLASEAFRDLAFYLRPTHLDSLADIVRDPATGKVERYICSELIKNAIISSGEVLPLCQDTGTATVFAWKGDGVITGGDDEIAIAEGIAAAYRNLNLRYSQMAALSMFEEQNTGSNLPAQIDISAVAGLEYHFLFIAKGAGSSNKTSFFQKTRAFLSPDRLEDFLKEHVAAIGADACPPYHIVLVVGGTSPEQNLKIQKLAAAGWLNGLPTVGDTSGHAFRDPTWEEKIMKIAAATGLGAQFGGHHMALDAKVIRLARHGGSCPVSLGVSCNAHRNMAGKITKEGVFLEVLDKNPARLLDTVERAAPPAAQHVDLDQPMKDILACLKGTTPGTMLLLSGTLVVARDIAHAKIYETVKKGGTMPDYMKKHPVCYAGPAKRPEGRVIGSFGPTTSKRMDTYLDTFMDAGASLISLGKGARTQEAHEACRRHGGFYLGTVGGAAALIAERHICSCDVIDFHELGMEAVHLIRVTNLPAFVLCDEKGQSFYNL